MPGNHQYRTGITRDDDQVFRRISDGEEVELNDWFPDYPKSNPDYNILYWYTWYNGKDSIVNDKDWISSLIICEY